MMTLFRPEVLSDWNAIEAPMSRRHSIQFAIAVALQITGHAIGGQPTMNLVSTLLCTACFTGIVVSVFDQQSLLFPDRFTASTSREQAAR